MIEAPVSNLVYFLILSFIIFCISVFLTFKKENTIGFGIGIVISISILLVGGYYESIDQTAYTESVNMEIENATCEQLPLMYNYYTSFHEKIKAKYIFDCVAEKEQLEWIK